MEIPLGFEIGSGKPVNIPVRHLCVTGQTQRAGKTRTLEALITRSGLRALTFLTKRGEGGFNIGRTIPPYFADGADWQFVESLIEASLKEKNKFQRAWVQKACRGAKVLADVQRNTKRLMKQATRSMDQDQFMLLDSYFDIVVPQIARLPKSPKLTIGPGLNVMNLIDYTPEMQMLVVRSAIEWIHRQEHGVITVIPECWKFVPEGKGSPVKAAAVSLVREGAALKNFVWLDAQDLRGVDKVVLGGCTVWILGVQRERNEIDRVLDNIPEATGKIKAEHIARLGIGQFYAAFDEHIFKTYVWPTWMTEDEARDVAKGKKKPFGPPDTSKPIQPTGAPYIVHGQPFPPAHYICPTCHGPVPGGKSCPKCNPVTTPAAATTNEEEEMSAKTDEKLDTLIALLSNQRGNQPPAGQPSQLVPMTDPGPSYPFPTTLSGDEEALYQRFKARLMQDAPVLIKVLTDRPEIEVTVEKRIIEVSTSKVLGRVAQLYAKRWFKEGKGFSETQKELQRTGPGVNPASFTDALKELVKLGFLSREQDGKYLEVAGGVVKIVEK
jgi:hypothetical protein